MAKEKFIINGLGGEKTLKGEVSVRGSKNAVLPVMASVFLFKDTLTIKNAPLIEDVARMSELLEDMGVSVGKKGERVLEFSSKKASDPELDSVISKRLRASVILTGPVLARFGKVSFPHPGGCVIGARPIDLFLEGFKKMGANVSEREGKYVVTATGGKLVGAEIFFKVQSVTATETFIMAGVLAKGKTVLKNVAIEPEVTGLADYLVSCGAKIKGIGTSTMEITGGGLLSAKKPYTTIPDRLEAGCFLILGALAAKDLLIKNCDPSHLEIVIELLRSSGVEIETGKNFIKVKGDGPSEGFKAVSIKTHEYPGFPTDIQAPMTVFLTQVGGESLVFETIFEGRLNFTQDLVKMGANITMFDPHRVMIKGPTPLKGKELEGPDIRAGLAFVIAGIIAKGESVINNVYYIDRGYEKIEERLQAIGVDIRRVPVEEIVVAPGAAPETA